MTNEQVTLANQIRRALIQRALAAFEDASVQGLCCEGAWEAAISALHDLDRETTPSGLDSRCLGLGARTGRGALIGAGIGTLGGLVVLLGQGLSDAPARSSSQQVLTIVTLGAVWSALGALVGSASDNWEPVP
jgi:hypothetical protein